MPDSTTAAAHSLHTWQLQEISLRAARSYKNPYADVQLWIDLHGPSFSKRIYGFWDGDNLFKIRFVATAPGQWHWTTGSNQSDNSGLNNHRGSLTAIDPSDAQKLAHPNFRGFLRATANGRALQYADGSPFFMLGDTWLGGATWRLPVTGAPTTDNYIPSPGISWEQAVAFRKSQGFNSISFIAAFPNWFADNHSHTSADDNGIYLRNAWEKFGVLADDDTPTAKDMHDERGNLPFALHPTRPGLADFDRINPTYFQSLDRKMFHLADQDFIPVFEPVRRDNCPTWKAYFDFNTSYSRYIHYLIARYGAFNIIFSGIHLDWIPEKYSLTADEFNAALNHYHKLFGPLPFGQPVTTLIDSSTLKRFGHAQQCPWLTMHSVGNRPRNHGVYEYLQDIFVLTPPYPAANLEPYYTGWDHDLNRPAGETPTPDSARDNYFSRAMMFGSVLSGGLAGHVHGTAAYDVTTTGEPPGWRPYIWDALRYTSANYMQHLRDFILCQGARYQHLLLASHDIHPRKSPASLDDGLEGWSFMMRTAEKDFALLYFENLSLPAKLHNFTPTQTYQYTWFNPRTGDWLPPIPLKSDPTGNLTTPPFPKTPDPITDWAAKLVLAN